MAKDLENLKNKNLIDEKELWVKGQIQKKFNWGMLFGAAGGAATAIANMRILSIKEDQLIVSKVVKKQPEPVQIYTKENVNTAVVKKGFLGLNRLLILDTDQGKQTFVINVNKENLDKLVELFN